MNTQQRIPKFNSVDIAGNSRRPVCAGWFAGSTTIGTIGMITALVLTGLFLGPVMSAPAGAGSPPAVPDPLKPWIPWVLHNQDQLLYGIPSYNDPNRLQCAWPTTLTVDVNGSGAVFSQDWRITCESWAILPGGDLQWPGDVRVNGAPAVTVRYNGRPAVKLPRGTHRVTGTLAWKSMPEYLAVPADTALVRLSVNGAPAPFPRLDAQGRLWFQVQRQVEEKVENRLAIQSFRLITDDIPAIMTVFLKLDISGSAREVVLGPVFDRDTFTPVSLTSDLPARLDPDGRLTIQLKPGQWTLRFAVRHTGPLASVTFVRPDDGYWPDQSIWSFESRNQLRIVDIDGASAIDPQQTSMPEEWRRFPAYRMLPGVSLTFRELKRGDPDPAPDQLKLDRTLWLRFDGSGYTIQDHITGKKTSDWRMEMTSPVQLGKVEVDGAIQFITERQGSGAPGVEIRRGAVDMTADSELPGKTASLPLTGWDQTFQEVNTNLALPPGYRLIHATGIDSVPDTWITRWNLLDLFFLLLFTVSVSRLYSRKIASLAFVTLGLLVNEPGAPIWLWLAVLVGAALLKYLPAGWFRKLVTIYQVVVVIILVAVSITFAVRHIRGGMYPQLEFGSSYGILGRSGSGVMSKAAPSPSSDSGYLAGGVRYDELEDSVQNVFEESVVVQSSYGREKSYHRTSVAQYDPSMLNQTGPGLPEWQWRSVWMKSGPTEPGRKLRLFMTGPATNRVLAFVRVILLVLLAFGLFGIRYRRSSGWSAPALQSLIPKTLLVAPFIAALLTGLSLASVFGLALGLTPARAYADEIPSQQMLDELRNRLLQRDDCFPECASVAEMTLRLNRDDLTISMQIQSSVDTAIPLPGNQTHWLPGRITLDRESVALFRRDDVLWAMVPEGIHTLELSGRMPSFNTVQLPLPMKPGRIAVQVDGWTVDGVRDNGMIDNQLQFSRIAGERLDTMQELSANVLPAFAQVSRTLLLGLEWRVETVVQRVSPQNAAIILEIPLLAGESVLTDGIEVKDGMARINLDASTGAIAWESTLQPSDVIELKHPDTAEWTETWLADISPILHLAYEGIPVVMHQREDRWFPMWHPWPGETVNLRISRPVGVPGQTLTIQKSLLDITPGKRVCDCDLKLTLQSSQGTQHAIGLPEDVQVHEITIDGKTQPIRMEGRRVPLTISPGTHDVEIKWRETREMRAIYSTPGIDLGIRSVNTSITVHFPSNRWLLWLWGPRLGPAVLFWPFICVIVIAAFLLSRTGMTPLKFRHWLLLGIGMSQGGLAVILIVVGWLLIMHLRRKVKMEIHPALFDLMQLFVVVITGIALVAMIVAIGQGLLGRPDMNVAGNNSSQTYLSWYQDSSGPVLPAAGVLSMPMFFYRVAMLLWALWIAFYMIHILKWVWDSFSKPVYWRPLRRKIKEG